jgi:hypothetical protein
MPRKAQITDRIPAGGRKRSPKQVSALQRARRYNHSTFEKSASEPIEIACEKGVDLDDPGSSTAPEPTEPSTNRQQAFQRCPPRNPDPAQLVWHPEAKAFRLRQAPGQRCVDCGGRTSFGEKIDCGLCDGRARRPVRFTGPWPDRCVYCGEETYALPGQPRVCADCEKIKQRVVAGGECRDDRILIEVHRALARRDRDALEAAEVGERRDRRKRRAARRFGTELVEAEEDV